ncbi:hypothetical protein Tco_0893315 [Tanacetum coccineum]|uniref:UBN2 domain-containing protein n=1 Tax=Tanacetum coccineum TaxID=301880 RepID=A0ABQ5C9S0_9ASTR
MECLVTRFIVLILGGFGVNPLRIKVESVLILEVDGMWSRYDVRTLGIHGYSGVSQWRHGGNNQVKDNKIDLLVQQYEQFIISEDESIDSAFARFNTIITSLKALDEGYSSKNYVRKFLRALHPKWRAKVMAIKESKN